MQLYGFIRRHDPVRIKFEISLNLLSFFANNPFKKNVLFTLSNYNTTQFYRPLFVWVRK